MEMDRESAFTEHVEPLVREVRKACYEQKIPMFFTAAVSDGKQGTEYRSAMISPGLVDVTLSDNRIAKMANVANGFDTVPPAEVMELEFDAEQFPEDE